MDPSRLPNNFFSTSGNQMSLIADRKRTIYPLKGRVSAPQIRAERKRYENQQFKTKRYKYKITDKQRQNINKKKTKRDVKPAALWKYWRNVIMEQEEAHVGNQKVTNLFKKMKGVLKKDFVKNEELLNEVYALRLQYLSFTGRAER